MRITAVVSVVLWCMVTGPRWAAAAQTVHHGLPAENPREATPDSSSTGNESYLHYDLDLFSGGGGRVRNDYFLEANLLGLGIGFWRIPLLLSVGIIHFETLLPWNSETVYTHSVGVRYVWNAENGGSARYVYAEGHWGTYGKNKQEQEEQEEEWSCTYLVVGAGYSMSTRDFEVGGMLFNGFDVRVGYRLGPGIDGTETHFSGVYGVLRLRLGWFGIKRW